MKKREKKKKKKMSIPVSPGIPLVREGKDQ